MEIAMTRRGADVREYISEIVSHMMPTNTGLDYDGIQFAVTVVDRWFVDQVLTIINPANTDWTDDDKFIVFSVPVVRQWDSAYGRQTAIDMAAFCIAHEMGHIHLFTDSDMVLHDGEVSYASSDDEAVCDAYARTVLRKDKAFIQNVLTRITASTLKDYSSLSLWKQAVIETKINTRVSNSSVKMYVWEGKVEDLSVQIYRWAELLVTVCADSYIPRD